MSYPDLRALTGIGDPAHRHVGEPVTGVDQSIGIVSNLALAAIELYKLTAAEPLAGAISAEELYTTNRMTNVFLVDPFSKAERKQVASHLERRFGIALDFSDFETGDGRLGFRLALLVGLLQFLLGRAPVNGKHLGVKCIVVGDLVTGWISGIQRVVINIAVTVKRLRVIKVSNCVRLNESAELGVVVTRVVVTEFRAHQKKLAPTRWLFVKLPSPLKMSSP